VRRFGFCALGFDFSLLKQIAAACFLFSDNLRPQARCAGNCFPRRPRRRCLFFGQHSRRAKILPRLESPRRRFLICFSVVLAPKASSLSLGFYCAARNFASCGETSRRRRDSFRPLSRKARRVLILRCPSISYGAHRQALSHLHWHASVLALGQACFRHHSPMARRPTVLSLSRFSHRRCLGLDDSLAVAVE
jgi:hypothetical protein